MAVPFGAVSDIRALPKHRALVVLGIGRKAAVAVQPQHRGHGVTANQRHGRVIGIGIRAQVGVAFLVIV